MNGTIASVPLKVAALGFAPRVAQTLGLFFQGPCGGRCQLVKEESAAELVLVDVDSPEGVGHWRRLEQGGSVRPVVAVALREPTPPPPWFLAKPVGKEAFLELLTKLQPSLRSSEAPAAPAPKAVQPPKDRTSFGQAAQAAQTNIAAHSMEAASFSHFIRGVADADPRDAGQRARLTYDPARHLQGHLKKACDQAAATGRVLRLRGPWRDIVVFPDTREVMADLNDAHLRSITVVPVEGRDQAQLAALTPAEAEELRRSAKRPLESQEAFLWKVALWSSRGRLPADTAWDGHVQLRHWPNLTRLILTPNAFQLAALWVRRPCSPLQAASLLKLPQPAVFAFYSAAHALGLMEHHEAEFPTVEPTARPPARGLLARILRRLRGT